MSEILSEIGFKIGWDLLGQSAAGAGFVTLILFMIAHYAFEALPRRAQQITFAVGAFMRLALL
jgi:hypothetical protein